MIGIRYDEPRRWRILGQDAYDADEFKIAPLVDAHVGLPEVTAFWLASPFDLHLLPDEGNCDLCFLKGVTKRLTLIRRKPEMADWWIEQERYTTGWFRKDTPNYAALKRDVETQPKMDFEGDSDLTECYCHD